jgi:hypothetical protein
MNMTQTDIEDSKPERKKPGPKPRNQAGMNPIEAAANPMETGQDRASEAHNPKRPSRIPMGSASKLAIPFAIDEDNFYYRYVTEERFHQSKQAYYEPVEHPETGVVHKIVFKGVTSILMRLPLDYRKEDLQAKRKKVINTLQDEKSGGLDKSNSAVPEYSGIEGRTGAVQVEGGFDPNSPYS